MCKFQDRLTRRAAHGAPSTSWSRWKRAVAICGAVGLSLIVGAGPSVAAQKLALVIGNDTYNGVSPLERAVADSRAYKKLLAEKRGFKVIYAENANRREMNSKIYEFLSLIKPGDVTMVVYSGHGVQLDPDRRDSLYFLPTDFPDKIPGKGAERAFFDAEAVNFARLSQDIQGRGAKLRVYVLDACRNNPFKGSGTRSIGMTRGIGRIQSSSGEFVIYAAAPGEVAYDRLPADSDDGNSVFTRSFIKFFTPGAYLEDVANDVQEEVLKLTRAASVRQEPYYSDGVAGRTCLDGTCRKPGALPITPKTGESGKTGETAVKDEREELFWRYCAEKNIPEYCKAYLKAFPASWRAPLAQARLIELMSKRKIATGGGANPEGPTKTGSGDGHATDSSDTRSGGDGKTATGGSDGDGKTATGGSDGDGKAGAGEDGKIARVDPTKEIVREIFRASRDQIRDSQIRLRILGYRPGGADGQMGPRTRRAIRAFTRAEKMGLSSELTSTVYDKLVAKVSDGKVRRYIEERRAAIARDKAAREARLRDARLRDARRKSGESGTRATGGRPEGGSGTRTGTVPGAETGAPSSGTAADKREAERLAAEAAERARAARAARSGTGGKGRSGPTLTIGGKTYRNGSRGGKKPWICTADLRRAKYDPACR